MGLQRLRRRGEAQGEEGREGANTVTSVKYETTELRQEILAVPMVGGVYVEAGASSRLCW